MFGKQKRYFTYRDRKRAQKRSRRLIVLILFFFGGYQIITSLIAAPLAMGNISMEPRFGRDSCLLFSPLIYGVRVPLTEIRFQPFAQPQRGDVVVIKNPDYSPHGQMYNIFSKVVMFFTLNRIDPRRWGREPWEHPYVVKRVIAVPGDTFRMENYEVYIKPQDDSFFLTEYERSNSRYQLNLASPSEEWQEEVPLSGYQNEMTLNEDEYYLLGDNRPHSVDSRFWGPLRRDNIKGRVLFAYWPLGRF